MFFYFFLFIRASILLFDNRVIEVIGDSENHSLQLVAKANIIITTPEKWDSLHDPGVDICSFLVLLILLFWTKCTF